MCPGQGETSPKERVETCPTNVSKMRGKGETCLGGNLSTTGLNLQDQPSLSTIRRPGDTNGGGSQQATACTIVYGSTGQSRVMACVVAKQYVQGATSARGSLLRIGCCGEIDDIDGSARRTAAGNGSTNISYFPA